VRRALAATLLVAGCGVAPDPNEQARLREGTEAVRATLVNPESAVFRAVAVHDGGGARVVCGEVDGGVGLGRTGYERFIVEGDKVVIASQLPTEAAMTERWNRLCR